MKYVADGDVFTRLKLADLLGITKGCCRWFMSRINGVNRRNWQWDLGSSPGPVAVARLFFSDVVLLPTLFTSRSMFSVMGEERRSTGLRRVVGMDGRRGFPEIDHQRQGVLWHVPLEVSCTHIATTAHSRTSRHAERTGIPSVRRGLASCEDTLGLSRGRPRLRPVQGVFRLMLP